MFSPNSKLTRSEQHNTIESVEADEKVLCNIQRHPFGLIKIYFLTLIGLIAAFFLLYMLMAGGIEQNSDSYTSFVFFAVIVSVITGMFLVVSTVIYNQTKLIVTDENIIKIQQIGLFFRRASQIYLADIEDVSSIQHSIFASNFGFGTLRIETESEQKNFIFPYCPNIQRVAKIVLDAKENYLASQNGQYLNIKSISE